LREPYNRILGRGRERGDLVRLLEGDAGRGAHPLHLRQQRRGMAADLRDEGVRVVAREVADLEIEAAVARHDVECGPARDDAGLDRRIGRHEARIERPLVAPAPGEPADVRDDLGRGLDGVDADMGQGRVTLAAVDVAAQALLALVRDHRLHRGGLADDAEPRPHGPPRERRDQRPDAEAADFLVIGHGNVDRNPQAAGAEFRHRRQRRRDEALHVGGAAPVKLAVALADDEGIAIPILAVHRNHVAVAGQHHAAAVGWTDRGEEIGLAAIGIVDELALDAEAVEIIAHELDEAEIRFPARSVEGDEPPDHLDAGNRLCHSRLALWRTLKVRSAGGASGGLR